MKPRLRYRWGVWACGLIAQAGYPFYIVPIGYGHTASEAYDEWKAQIQ